MHGSAFEESVSLFPCHPGRSEAKRRDLRNINIGRLQPRVRSGLLCYCCDRPPWGAPASGLGLRKMPQQSNLFSSSPPSGSTVQERQAAPQRPSRIPLWLRRVELYLYVIIRIYIGVIVLVLPWYAPLWADNQLLNHFPRLATFLMYGAVRGVVSGLGLLNLWIAIVEAVHFRGSSS